MHHQQPFTSTSTAFVFPPETVVQTPVVINSGTISFVLYNFGIMLREIRECLPLKNRNKEACQKKLSF